MRYVSIDIETTGLDPTQDQILEIGAVIDDLTVRAPLDQLPSFQAYIKWPRVSGQPYALAMNSEILKAINDGGPRVFTPDRVMPEFQKFLLSNGVDKVVAAGKNFASFDRQFINRLENSSLINFHHRYLDPAILYCQLDDPVPPTIEQCMERAGLKGVVPHRALDDAKIVVLLLRKWFS